MKTKIRTLIVEDDFMVSRSVREFTERLDSFSVIGEARSGREALQLIERHTIDFLITDIYMPDLDGIQLLRKIKSFEMPPDVIVVTAAKEMDAIQQVLRLGVVDYIMKPFNFDRYEYALRNYQQRFEGYRLKKCTQQTLDQILHTDLQSFSADQLPKGLQQVTLNRVLEQLKNRPVAQNTDEIGQAIGLSRATIQRYLRYLVSTEKVETVLTYGTKGRPEHKYIYQNR